MKPEEQIKALAELDGKWKQKEFEDDYAYTRSFGSTNSFMSYIINIRLPHYLTSYDAIIPLIQKQPYEIRFSIAMSAPDGRISFMSTPSQLCEALLRATEKWKD